MSEKNRDKYEYRAFAPSQIERQDSHFITVKEVVLHMNPFSMVGADTALETAPRYVQWEIVRREAHQILARRPREV